MICIYEKNETSFTYNGLGTLEPSYCSFSPFINDVWQLEMYLPYDPEGKYKLVENGRILKVTGIDCIQEQTSDYQLFSIETYRKEGNSIYVLAYPVGMDARFDTYANQVNANYKTASEAIALINAVKAITLNNQEIDKYTVSTNIYSPAVKSEVWNNTNIIAMLTDDEKGFIHKWGGEVCYDNYNIKVNESLGRTTGASEVRYGKNIRGMSYEEDSSQVITRLYPVANGGEILNGISAYKIENEQYVDSVNVADYSIPHIGYVNAPFNLVQLSNDGSEAYAASILAYNQIKEDSYAWIRDALLGENTGGVDGLLVDIEFDWFQKNYGLTMDNDGTEGLVEYVTNKICNNPLRPIRSSAVKNLIYSAIKAGFDGMLNEETLPSTKKLWSTFYSYTWDDLGNFRVNKNGDADYAWVYANSKWNQLDNDGYLTGAVDSATWKWYKVSGKNYKRYGNKKKKRYLKSQWWNINGVWYWFDDEGEATSGADLQSSCYDMFDSMNVSGESIYEALDYCQGTESGLFELLYTQMTDYCINYFATEKISYPTPSINIDMIDLSKTVEYAGYESLLKVKLGDTVKCVNNKLNIYTDLRVTGLTYDVIKGCNTNIQIGLTESSIISKFDKLGNDTSWQKNGLVAGDGIKIENNIISATGVKVTDVVVKNQSVVYGGKAFIDIDEISGEGLQWFEETEDALYGVTDLKKLVLDPQYKVNGSTTLILRHYRSGEYLNATLAITISDSNSLLMYYPYDYFSKSPYICNNGNGYIPNVGLALILTKSTSVGVWFVAQGGIGERTGTFNLSEVPINSSWYHVGTGAAGYGIYAWKTYVEIDGEEWYGAFIADDILTFENHCDSRSIIDYLTVAQYPSGHPYQGHYSDVAYDTCEEAISAVLNATISISEHNFNGISREGDLAFFAGANDEHGTDAPIKIYRDGSYEGLDKVVDIQVDDVSVVDENKIAKFPSFQPKLIPGQGIVIDEMNHIYTGSEDSRQLTISQSEFYSNWETYTRDSMTIEYAVNSVSELPSLYFAYAGGSDLYAKATYKVKIPKEIEYIEFDIMRGNTSYEGTQYFYFILREDYQPGYTWPMEDFIVGSLAFTYVRTIDGIPTYGEPLTWRLDCSNVNVDSYLYLYDTGFTAFISRIEMFERVPEYSDYNGTSHGLVPVPSSGQTGYLKEDGSWKEPVIANPTGTASDTLTKVLIGDTIYRMSGGGASTLAELTDVNISSPQSGEALVYNATTQKWENRVVSGGEATSANYGSYETLGETNMGMEGTVDD